VHEILTYVWDDWRGAGKDSRSAKERPKDINKDFPDCIRYLCMYNPFYFTQDESDPKPYKTNSVTAY